MTYANSMTATLVLTCAALLAITLNSTSGWRTDSRPKLYGNRLHLKMLRTERPEIQRKILSYHNKFRSHVKPSARDMQIMTWHPKAAHAAQRWAEECQFLKHDNASGRFLPAFGSCGQNIFVSTHRVPWFFAIKTWYMEKEYFEYNSSTNNLTDVGHYTQLVWANSHKVGCGIAKCDSGSVGNVTYYSYICNYCPIGNYPHSLGRPYTAGPWCSSCERHCSSRRLCTNTCPAADRWSDCLEIYRSWPDWLCKGRGRPGRKRRAHCQATCRCQAATHQNKHI